MKPAAIARNYRRYSFDAAIAFWFLCFQPEGFGQTVIHEAYVKASNPGEADRFGYSIGISGDTLVVGALGENGSSAGVNGDQAAESLARVGAAYVYIRAGTNWSQQAYIKASNPAPFDQFGISVAISGDIIVVGSDGEDSSSTGVNGAQDSNGAGGSGAAYVFVRDGTNWTQQAYLKASNTGLADGFGFDVAVSGDTIVIGAPKEGSDAVGVNGNQMNNSALNSGAAYVFVRDGTNWVQQAYLKASNTGANDWFGEAVAISGETIVVASRYESSDGRGVNAVQSNNNANQSGAAYVFVRNGTNWSQQAYLKASNADPMDWFGEAVSVSGDTIVVGAYAEKSLATGVNGDQTQNVPGGGGAAYVFVRNGGSWIQEAYLKASNTGSGDFFGGAVSVSGNVIVAGAYPEDSNATGVNGTGTDPDQHFNSGAAYLFIRDEVGWKQLPYLKASNTGAADWFGTEVAVSDGIVAVGAVQEDSGAPGINGNQADDSVDAAGAVYVYDVGGSSLGVDFVLTNVTFQPVSSGFGFGFTGVPNRTYQVLGSPNVTLPISSWTLIGTMTEGPPGTFTFQDSGGTSEPSRYYRLRAE